MFVITETEVNEKPSDATRTWTTCYRTKKEAEKAIEKHVLEIAEETDFDEEDIYDVTIYNITEVHLPE